MAAFQPNWTVSSIAGSDESLKYGNGSQTFGLRALRHAIQLRAA